MGSRNHRPDACGVSSGSADFRDERPGRVMISERETSTRDILRTVLLTVIVSGALLFIMIAYLALTGRSQALDESILQFLNPQQSLGWRQEAFRDMTALGGYTVLVTVVSIAVLFERLSRRRAAASFLLLTVISGYLVNMVMKRAFARPRPEEVLRLSFVESSSFPSGHSMMATIVYVTLGLLAAHRTRSRRVQMYLVGLPILVAAFVGISRVYLGVHYPSDVLAGWSMGLVWTATSWFLFRQRCMERSCEPVETSVVD